MSQTLLNQSPQFSFVELLEEPLLLALELLEDALLLALLALERGLLSNNSTVRARW